MSLVNFSACLARRYAAAYEAKPIQTAVTSGVVIKTGADVFGQLFLEKRPLDTRRTLAMAVFSASIGGYGNYVFIREASKLASAAGGARGALAAAGADVPGYGPLVYLPAYTLAMGAAANKSLSDAAMTLRRQWREATACSVAILGPAQAVNFSVVPYGLRLPFMLGAAFVYNAALSSINLRALSASS